MDINTCWKFDSAVMYGRSEKELWYCKHCNKKVVSTMYRGKRSNEELLKPCSCSQQKHVLL